MKATDNRDNNAIIIRAMLKDDEFMAGGIFSKEGYYMRKYGLSFDEMSELETRTWKAVSMMDFHL